MKKRTIVILIGIALLGAITGCIMSTKTNNKVNKVDKNKNDKIEASEEEPERMDIDKFSEIGTPKKPHKDNDNKLTADKSAIKEEGSESIKNTTSKDKSAIKEEGSESIKNTTSNSDKVSLKVEKDLSFTIKNTNNELQFATPWKHNNSKTKQVAIEGRGPEGIEEGDGYIVIKDSKGMKRVDIKQSTDRAPSYVEWLDDENLLVVLVSKNGRVLTQGVLYKVNINDLKPYVIYRASKTEEILEINNLADDSISIKMRNYNPDGTYAPTEKTIVIS